MKNTSFNLPADVRDILLTFEKLGYDAYIVGGFVRDSILNRQINDFDIATDALPDEIESLFSKTFPQGKSFGTVAVFTGERWVEVTTFRHDGEYVGARKPRNVTFSKRIEEDLQRRDFTVNAVAYHIKKGVIDLFNGVNDIHNGIIRAVGDPICRFNEDALRILRAYRFAAVLGFSIEEETRRAAIKSASLLDLISGERVREELFKILESDNPDEIWKLDEDGILSFNIAKASISLKDVAKEEIMAAFFLCLSENSRGYYIHRLRLSNEQSKKIRDVAEIDKIYKREFDRASVKRLMFRFGVNPLISYALISKEQDLLKLIKDIEYTKEPYNLSGLNLTGNDLIDAGFEAGRNIGIMMKNALEHCIEVPKDNKKDILISYLKNNAL